MARILYGIMGNTRGHVMRARAIMDKWKGHEFYIVGGGRVAEAFKNNFPVLEVPVLRTVHSNQSVNIPAVMEQIGMRVLEIPEMTKRILGVIETWQPQLAICDREFFLPLACKRAGLRCISVNHSHVLLSCKYRVPKEQFISWSLAMLNDLFLFNHTKENCIVSFFHPPLKNPQRDKLFPPVLRPEVSSVQPSHKNHILVYQTSPTFGALMETLKYLKRPVLVYGFKNEQEVCGNVTFKSYNRESILEDLASCAYAVTNGGHNLISEALYFSKPVLCFPIKNLFEQFLNSWHVRKLGYGDFSTAKNPTVDIFKNFEAKLSAFHIPSSGEFDGTMKVVNYLEQIAESLSCRI